MTDDDVSDQNPPARFQILSLDGGGLKGLFSASFLAAWEAAERRRVADSFDLIAGTSTGGIIALALGLGFPARDILNFYLEEADSIFPTRLLGEIQHWVGVKHDASGLEQALQKYFGEKRLGDSAVPLIIPAYYPKAADLYLFKTPHHRRLRTDYRELARDVARATSAAPTYLSAFKADTGAELVDGGVWANNPVMLAITEALGYFGVPQDRISALRVGTTTEIKPVSGSTVDGGKLMMCRPAIEYMMRGQERSASTMAYHILGARYHEVNIVAAPGDFALDKLSQDLIGLGHNQWRINSSDLAEKGFLSHQRQEYKPCYKL